MPPVDYAALDAVCAQARERFPEAIEVRPIWSNGLPMADVRTAHATGFTWNPEREDS